MRLARSIREGTRENSSPFYYTLILAGITGFEPVQRVPKTHVLPLHYIPVYCGADKNLNSLLCVTASSFFYSIEYIFVFFQVKRKGYPFQMLFAVLLDVVFIACHFKTSF